MKCKALKTFLHDQLGRVEKGIEFEATEAQLSGVRRFVEVYETKPEPVAELETKPERDAPVIRRRKGK
jgi:hypothetical protein